jgi:hypothetical protein
MEEGGHHDKTNPNNSIPFKLGNRLPPACRSGPRAEIQISIFTKQTQNIAFSIENRTSKIENAKTNPNFVLDSYSCLLDSSRMTKLQNKANLNIFLIIAGAFKPKACGAFTKQSQIECFVYMDSRTPHQGFHTRHLLSDACYASANINANTFLKDFACIFFSNRV